MLRLTVTSARAGSLLHVHLLTGETVVAQPHERRSLRSLACGMPIDLMPTRYPIHIRARRYGRPVSLATRAGSRVKV